MLSSCRHLLALPGAAAFSAAGLVARLPYSMTGLAIVLLVSERSGSYADADAGAVAAVAVLAGAVAGPPLARLIDRRGQSVVLPVAGGRCRRRARAGSAMLIRPLPARLVGPGAMGGETVDKSSPVGADPGRRTDA